MDKKALGYCRVSTDEQAQHGISIEAQHEMIRAWGTMSGNGPVTIYEDPGFSGKNMNRPQLQRLLQECKTGTVSHVVVWKLDRLSRSLRDTLTVIEDLFLPNGITLVSVTEQIDTSTPAGRMMLNMLASFAQLEREQDSDRVVMSHKHLARDCKYLGGHVPVGYRVDQDKHYQLDPETWPTVRRVFEMYLEDKGYTEILETLNSIPNTNYRKTKFKKQDLNFILQNEIYAGTYIRKMGADPRHRITAPETIRIPGGVPAILSPEEWVRVCAKREMNRTTAARYNTRNIYPLSGLVFCSVCNKPMRLNVGGHNRDGTIQRYYECKEKHIRAARLEQIQESVMSCLESYATQAPEIRKACAIVNSYSDAAAEENAAEIRLVNDQIMNLNKQSGRIISFISTTDNPPESLMKELQTIEREQKKLSDRLQKLSTPAAKYDMEKTVESIVSCKDIKKRPPERQKEQLQTAVYKISVSDEEYKILFNWHTCCGDEPPQYVCQSVIR